MDQNGLSYDGATICEPILEKFGRFSLNFLKITTYIQNYKSLSMIQIEFAKWVQITWTSYLKNGVAVLFRERLNNFNSSSWIIPEFSVDD